MFRIEFRHKIRPIPSKIYHEDTSQEWHNHNTELFVSYQSEMINNREFYTDSNGLHMVQRVYGKETRYNEPPIDLEKNLYPINKLIMARDLENGMEVGINVDRPCAATVLPNSSFLVSLTRSTFSDDDKGMGERVDNLEFLTIKHILFFGSEVLKRSRKQQVRDDIQPMLVLRSISEHEQFLELKEKKVLKIQELRKELADESVYFYFQCSFNGTDYEEKPTKIQYYLTFTNLQSDKVFKFRKFKPRILQALNLYTSESKSKEKWTIKELNLGLKEKVQNLQFGSESPIEKKISKIELKEEEMYLLPLELRTFSISKSG